MVHAGVTEGNGEKGRGRGMRAGDRQGQGRDGIGVRMRDKGTGKSGGEDEG